MMRLLLSALAGYAAWTVCWLGSNALLQSLWPSAFTPDGGSSHAGLLLLLLMLSVVFSMGAGALTDRLAAVRLPRHRTRPALILGVALLATGLFVQFQFWALLPVWYHVGFLALLLPGVLVGARLARAWSERPSLV